MMKIERYDSNKPLLILLHSGNSSEAEWEDGKEKWKENYSLWIPTISGHGKDEGPYTSIYENAEELLKLVKEQYQEAKIIARGLGAQIAIQMMEMDPKYFTHAILESPLCVPTGLLKWMLSISAKISYYPKSGEMEKKKFIRMLKDNSSFLLQESIKDFEGKALIFYSVSEDKLIKKSVQYLEGYMKNSQVLSFPYPHGMGISHRDELLPIWEAFLKDEPIQKEEKNENIDENKKENGGENL